MSAPETNKTINKKKRYSDVVIESVPFPAARNLSPPPPFLPPWLTGFQPGWVGG